MVITFIERLVSTRHQINLNLKYINVHHHYETKSTTHSVKKRTFAVKLNLKQDFVFMTEMAK